MISSLLNMKLERVTSLADLIFKAKQNKYYRQAVVIGCCMYKMNYYHSYIGKPISDKEFNNAVEYFQETIFINHSVSCDGVISWINKGISQVREEVTPNIKDETYLKWAKEIKEDNPNKIKYYHDSDDYL